MFQEGHPPVEAQGHRIFVFAFASYCIRKSAHVGALVVLFFVGISALDLLHAIYMLFFLVYLVFPRSAKLLSIWLVSYCEAHFAVLYLFRLAWFRGLRTDEWRPILDVIGLWRLSVVKDFAGVAALLCFSAVQYHGVRSLKQLEGENFRDRMESHWATAKLTAMVKTVNRAYRQWGIYIAYVTVLLVVCTVPHSFVGFTYLAFLLSWVTANHAVNNVRHSRLWVPFMGFLGTVAVLRYIFGAFPSVLNYVMRTSGLSPRVMRELGLDTSRAPLMEKLWDCAVLLCTVQMYRYNRAHSPLEKDSDEEPGEEAPEPSSGSLAFLKRLLIIHAHKGVAFAVFFAALTPVSLLGFLYLVFLVVTCLLPKTSQNPPRVYIVYTALWAAAEYGYQILGPRAVGTRYQPLLAWFGFNLWGDGFYATQTGLLSKALVLAASVLQLVSLAWLDALPNQYKGDQNDVEPCSLFAANSVTAPNSAQTPLSLRSVNQLTTIRTPRTAAASASDSNLSARARPDTEPLLRESERDDVRGFPQKSHGKPGEPSGSGSALPGAETPDNSIPPLGRHSSAGVRALRWARRAHEALKQERYVAQLRSLRAHVKHVAEHFFLLYGLEVTMLTLLFAAFALLNVFSLVYVSILGACVVMERRNVRRIWPYLVFLFAGILLAEYAVLAGMPGGRNEGREKSCHGCWDCAEANDRHCWMCWLGAAADEKRMIGAHFLVFLLAAYQHRVHVALGDTPASRYRPVLVSEAMKDAWRPITYDFVSQWTWLDHVRFVFYRHLLLLVLTLVFATGSLNYDLLHFGYLAFSLVFFRIRSQIMTRGNAVLNYLRLYNFLLIIASLVYQAPAFEYKTAQSCSLPYDIWNIIGLYKYEYGVTVSAQGALVDMIIFVVVALQSWVFTTPELAQVRRYLEAEEMYARAQAHERRAEWKKQELQRIQRTEETKRNRRVQVNKIKKDIVQMKTRLDFLNSAVTPSPKPSFELQQPRAEEKVTARKLDFHQEGGGLERSIVTPPARSLLRPEGLKLQKRSRSMESMLGGAGEIFDEPFGSPEIEQEAPLKRTLAGNQSAKRGGFHLDRASSDMEVARRNVRLGIHFLGDGFTQVQSLGNRALANLVDYLKLDEEQDEAEGELFGEVPRAHETDDPVLNPRPSEQQEKPNEKQVSAVRRSGSWPRIGGEESGRKEGGTGGVGDSMRQLGIIAGYVGRLLRANTHVVCYALFVVVFVWNFSLLTSVYAAALFAYALLASPGPGGEFWLGILIYTEFNILIQYTYQIPVSNSCRIIDPASNWAKLIEYCGIRGFQNSFFLSVLPLFLVYLATLVHSSLTKREGEWTLVGGTVGFGARKRSSRDVETGLHIRSGLTGFWSWGHSLVRRLRLYWRGVVYGCEAPPHFVLLTMRVDTWPEGGIQPESIEAGMNRLLAAVHTEGSRPVSPNVNTPPVGSVVRVESIDHSPDRPHEAVAVLEVLHVANRTAASVAAARARARNAETLTPAADVAAEVYRMKEERRELACGFPYPIESVVAGGRREVDLYAYVFFADMLSFFFAALFYQSAVGARGSIFAAAYEQDQFPKEFVYVLLTLFSLMAVDRVLYLCSFARAHLLYYFASLLLFTTYTVHLFWNPLLAHSRTTFQLFYLVRALSLGLTATQIKYGPPRDSAHGQFLMRRVDTLHSLGFTIYRVLPFVYELRTVLDWSCASTALMLYDWLKMEDIYASLYQVTCDLKLNRERHKLGRRQEFGYKFWSGFVVFLGLCTVIWAPMVLFSTGNPTNYYNPIQDVRMAVYLDTQEGTFPVYEAGARRRIEFYKPPENAFLQQFDVHEIQRVCCFSDADAIWQVPPPTQRSLVKILAQPAQLRTVWTFTRARPVENAVVFNESLYARESQQEVADTLSRVLNGSSVSAGFPHLYPKYFRLPGLGPPRALEGSQDVFVGGNLTFHGGPTPWWSFERFPEGDESDRDDCEHEGGPMAIAVSEEVPGGFIGTTLSKFGLAGLYITFVLGVHRLVRLQSSDLRMRIPYENFPSTDRLVAICEDIYAARAEGELELEEGLFWTLIKIYRSPHILMEYTKADKVD